jgi:acyl-ACP thioesterase
MATRRPVRVSNELLQEGRKDESVFKDSLQKIKLPGNLNKITHKRVVFSDLDIMGHVNNVKYMEWTLDAIISDGNINHRVREFEINFMNEARLGDEIVISGNSGSTLISGDEVFVQGLKAEEDKEIFRVRLSLR